MFTLHRARLSLVTAISTILLFSTPLVAEEDEDHTTFIFNQFNGSNIILMRNASIISNVIKLTGYAQHLIGRALYSTPVRIMGPGAMGATESMSFSTTFVFTISPNQRSSNTGGHGLAFVMTPYKSFAGALSTQYLGMLNFTSNGQSYNHLFAVEFDTVMNSEFQDIDDNHVGVDLNSLHSVTSRSAGFWIGNKFQQLNLKGQENIQAWIDYDHLRKQLNVTIAPAGWAKPIRPLICVDNIDLASIFQEKMYVGFSGSTGVFNEEHYILAWSFSANGTAPALDLSGLPSFKSKQPVYKSTAFIAGVTVASVVLLLVSLLSAACWIRKLRDREFVEEWELQYWPHRFSYKELRAATKGFRDKELLGSGGFGRVYKGVIRSTGLQVAVKCIDKEVTEGMKEFIAEISSMGRMQHRNLVQLQGWCRKNQQLFIVYDYMANGSLDGMLFGSSKAVLTWPQRYGILKGIAAGLLYLHEQWEKKVVHRDIKSSNVLLDSELNARLSDFGFARLYDHTQDPHTTLVVGTLGYIAPELIHTGRATPSSDVFSFGIIMLEVACGRRPVELISINGEQVILVEWVRELYSSHRLMETVDPRLGTEYEEEEMERVLQLGLCCSHPDPQRRLPIAQVSQILEGEGALPTARTYDFRPDTASTASFRSRENSSCDHLLSMSEIVNSSSNYSTLS